MIRELEQALDALLERQRVVDNNLANVNTPGFQRGDVDFFGHMRQVFEGYDPVVEVTRDTASPERLDGNNVNLESEMFALTQTDLLFQTATRLASEDLQRLRYAITEGRG